MVELQEHGWVEDSCFSDEYPHIFAADWWNLLYSSPAWVTFHLYEVQHSHQHQGHMRVGGLAAEEEVKISWLLPWQGLTASYQDTWPSHICTVYCVVALPWAQRILSISTTSAIWRLELLPYPKKLTVSQNSWLPPGPLVIHSPLLECSLHLGWGHIIISLHFLSIQRQGHSNSYTFWAI